MFLKSLLITAASVATAMAAVPASAVTVFTVTLAAANEVPPTMSSGTGGGTLTLSDDMNMLTANISFTGLTAPALEGHLHCCAPLGSDAPVAIPLSVSPSTAGMLTGTVDLTMLAAYDAEFLSAYGGTVSTLRSALLSGLENGQGYINIHTATYPMGEIRGQVLTSAAEGGTVPEPAQWALMLTGFTMVGAAARRRAVAA